MNNDNVGRVAFLGILGVVGAIAITKPELNDPAQHKRGQCKK